MDTPTKVDIAIAKPLYDFIDAALKTTLSTGATKLMLALGALIGTFWLLNFTLRSIKWLHTGLDRAVEDIVTEIFKLAFIAGMAFNVPWYIATIVPAVTNAPGWISALLSSNTGVQATQITQIDAMASTFINTLLDMMKAMSFDIWDIDFSAILNAVYSFIFYVLGGGLFLLVSVVTVVVLKTATTLLLVLGPLFIAFALFDKTRQYFYGWVSQIAGFMLTQVMFSVVLAMEVSFVNTVILKDGHFASSLSGTFTMFIFFLAMLALLVELPGYAASIMGGSAAGASAAGLGGMAAKATGLRTAKMITGLARSKMPRKNTIA